jgi:diaminopimelate epimerase
MKFTKMHGTGNDFIMINALEETLPADLRTLSKKLADRHFGIGADQVLIVDRSNKADFKMLIFNNDGSEVEMCGNGIRCLARYVKEKGLTEKTSLEIETLAGIIKPKIIGNMVKVDMGEPKLKTADWKIEDNTVISKEIVIRDKTFNATLISVGNPHCIIFKDDITDEDVLIYGPKIENNELFPNRINVGFAKIIDTENIMLRTWERGTGETLACGTNATATSVAAILNNLTERKVTIHVKGGTLDLEWAADDHVYMTGPAEFVYEGEIKKW